MQRFRLLFLMLTISVLVFNCQKEISYTDDGTTPVVTNPSPVSATLQGRVVDENGMAASGVFIVVGNKTATTDSRGYFRIIKASLDKYSAVVTAEKAGYFKAFRSFTATDGANHVSIKLIKKTLSGSINSTSGGDVTLANGAKVTLPADPVVKAAGGTYSGPINVYAAYIDPSAADISQTVPGSFMANDASGNRTVLTSYGMLAVELESTSGEKLQIASGKTATLTSPIPASLLTSAPASIALWYIDEATGIWKEEGTATKTGNNYVGTVKHFSFWNCDVSQNAVYLNMTLQNTEGIPLVNSQVKLSRANGFSSYGFTDSLGNVSGYVPNNESLVLQVLDDCNVAIFTQNIGPFTQNTNLGTITVPSATSGLVTVQGVLVNCSGAPVTNGYVVIDFVYPRYVTVGANGQFTLSMLVCNTNPLTLDITGVDNTAQQQATVSGIAITSPVTNTGNITACGTSAVQYINYTVDGVNYALSSTVQGDSLTAFSSQQGGTQSETYFNGLNISTNKSINIRFFSNTQSAGTYPISYIVAQNHLATSPSNGSNIVLTSFPVSAGGFYEGSFSGSYGDSTNINITHTISGTFRLRR